MEVSRIAPPDIQKSGEVPLVPPQVISLIGPELSGKSEQGRILSKRTNLPLIQMGNVFRELYKEDSELARKARENQGKYADDELFEQVFLWGLRGQDYSNGFIIEGAPRALSQFISFPEIVSHAVGKEMPINVAFLNVTRGHAYERQKRREAREDDVFLDSRLDEHYKDLADKIRTVRGYAHVFAVVPTVHRSQAGEISNDRSREEINSILIDKLKIDKTKIRTFSESQLTDGIRQIRDLLEFDISDVGHDIMTLPEGERLSAIRAYLKNIQDTFGDGVNGDDAVKSLTFLENYLLKLYADNIKI